MIRLASFTLSKHSPWGTVLKGTTMKSNYDTFASRGDPWDASERQTRDGELRPSGRRPQGVPARLSQEARLALLKAERSAAMARHISDLKAQALEHQKLEASLSVDLDHILKAGRAIPHGERLKKERNLVVAPLSAGAVEIPHSPLASIAATRARLRAMRQIVKVR